MSEEMAVYGDSDRLRSVQAPEIGEVDGEILTGADGAVVVEKESAQLKDNLRTAGQYAEMRHSPSDLLFFYDSNVWHRRCILIKALLVGGLGYRVEVGGKVVYDVKQKIFEKGHPAVDLLARPNPSNPLETFDQLVHRVLVDYYAMGNGYIEVARDRTGAIAELYHAPARTMRRDNQFKGYWQIKETRTVRFNNFGDVGDRNEILHLLQYDPRNDYYGAPDWLASIGTMGLDRTVTEFNTRLFANSLMAHTAVVVEGGKLSENARSAIRHFIQERGIGAANAGRVLLLEDERERVRIRFEKLNLDVKDVMVIDAQRAFRDAIVAVHGVPPRLLGIMSAGQLGGTGEVEGQMRTFAETVLRPGQRMLEDAFNVLLEEIESGARIRFEPMDVTDRAADAEFFKTMIEAGVYTAEEVRKIIEAGQVG